MSSGKPKTLYSRPRKIKKLARWKIILKREPHKRNKSPSRTARDKSNKKLGLTNSKKGKEKAMRRGLEMLKRKKKRTVSSLR